MVKIFCGNGDIVPPGYDQLGTRYQCLQKGFGAGLYKSRAPSVPWWGIAGLLVLLVLVLVVVYKRTKEKHQRLKYGRTH